MISDLFVLENQSFIKQGNAPINKNDKEFCNKSKNSLDIIKNSHLKVNLRYRK